MRAGCGSVKKKTRKEVGIEENGIVFWRCYALLENKYIILSGLEINFLFSSNNTNFNVFSYACKKTDSTEEGGM